MAREALIDADILAYQAASSAETPVDWGDGMWTLHAFEDEAKANFTRTLEKILDKTEATEVTLAWSDSSNWRKDVYPMYKSNRSTTRKPMLLKFIREWAMSQYFSVSTPTLEGDDVMGILATDPSLSGKYIICTIDKDLKCIPGVHYNFGDDTTFEINTHDANKWHMYQTLTGDSTDGYPGCAGIGPKTAEKILTAALEEGTPWARTDDLVNLFWKHVVKAYEKAGLTEEFALSQARIARILRHSDFDKTNNEVKLWTPSKLAVLTT